MGQPDEGPVYDPTITTVPLWLARPSRRARVIRVARAAALGVRAARVRVVVRVRARLSAAPVVALGVVCIAAAGGRVDGAGGVGVGVGGAVVGAAGGGAGLGVRVAGVGGHFGFRDADELGVAVGAATAGIVGPVTGALGAPTLISCM